ncbi:invasion associated locus B family protein [Sphingomonas oligophenolica]|uniref:Uncharacterized protein n=1 Tax=Sphingomonas oligophenolica TaxID=301154 RepID=A0A502CN80_9SPHN|nr:invasion associated locus B family protein [Sphingomonas oligophenolica]TPG13599.1 hypothetical protein EAH84_05285 [Sphingomonas oligophenolica]
MKPAFFVLLLLGLATASSARDTIGVYRRWGAFRDAAPPRCFAIAQPIAAGGHSGGFASVATWPGKGLRNSLSIRLSRTRDRSAGVTLTVGERRFDLVANSRDAFAPDLASDRALVAALRSGRSMSIEGVADGGHPFADVYSLSGAATAIDAAALACRGQ